MIDLDQPTSYREVDAAGAIDRIFDLPQQIRDAWERASVLSLPDSYRGARNIVVCGMGGSAIGADLVRSLVEGAIQVPYTVVRGYDLPGWVNADTLVVLSSYSGATEEVLTNCEQALTAGAKILMVTTGGTLAGLARERDFPLVDFQFVGQPREGLAYSALLMLGVLIGLGYVANVQAAVLESADVLDEMANDLAPGVPTGDNPAKQLALRLHGRLPVVYGGGLLAEVARRWKGQFNENAKNWAFFEQLPELHHNAVVGYPNPEEVRERLTVLILSSDKNHPRIKLREGVTRELLAQRQIANEVVNARGESPLAHILSTVYFGDMVSYYLALLNGADPSEIDAINYLKSRLSEVPR